jgi:hypothetical protein
MPTITSSEPSANLWTTDLSGATPGGFVLCTGCSKIVPEEGAKFGTFRVFIPPEPYCRDCSKKPGFIDRADWSPYEDPQP